MEAIRKHRRGRRLLSLTVALALVVPTTLATSGLVAAQEGEGRFCEGTNIAFFPGGTEGGGFETVVYNGARAAQAALGANVNYYWSDWAPETMITQFGEAVATQPDGIAVMGHPGDSAFKPAIDDAVAQGIVVTVMNTELPEVQEEYAAQGTGYVGQVLYDSGAALANEAMNRGGLGEGDKAFVWGLESQPGRGQRTLGITETLREAGMEVVYLEIDDATNAEPAAGIPTFTGMASANPDLRAVFLDHGNVTSTARAYLDAAGLSPDDVYVAGFDIGPAAVDAIESGYLDLVIDQQQWLQGFMAVTQLCLAHNYGFSGLFVDTGGGFIDASNVEMIAPLVQEQIR
jgi:simple sugar transport system substrate-binding protein